MPESMSKGWIRVLGMFYDKGVTKVSPGALGMVTRGKPLEDNEAAAIANLTPAATWDGTWIVLSRHPDPGMVEGDR